MDILVHYGKNKWGWQPQTYIPLSPACVILLLRYREASVEVMEIMSHFAVIERASIDEAYIDLTNAVQERLEKLQGQPVSADLLPSTYIEGLPRGPAVEDTVEKGTCIASRYFCSCFSWLRWFFLNDWKET